MRKFKACWHNADDRGGFYHRFGPFGRRSNRPCRTGSPKTGNSELPWGRRRASSIGSEVPSEDRVSPQHFKGVGAQHSFVVCCTRAAVITHDQPPAAILNDAHSGKGPRLRFPVFIVRIRSGSKLNAAGLRCLDIDNAIVRVDVGESFEEGGVRDGEDGGVDGRCRRRASMITTAVKLGSVSYRGVRSGHPAEASPGTEALSHRGILLSPAPFHRSAGEQHRRASALLIPARMLSSVSISRCDGEFERRVPAPGVFC